MNLSQVQVSGGGSTPDNVRDVGIFDGQLYESSGSNSSIGKAVFQVGPGGLPTAATDSPQMLQGSRMTEPRPHFQFVDLDPSVPGVDTLYTSASAAGIGLHKYSKVPCSGSPACYTDQSGNSVNWVGNGYVGLDFDTVEFEATAVAVNGSTATFYATNHHSIYRLIDPSGYNQPITGTITPILTAGTNQTFRGMAFTPAAAATPGDYNGDHIVDAADYTVWRNHLGEPVVPFRYRCRW